MVDFLGWSWHVSIEYLYGIASLHLFIAYLYCISLLHIFKAYLGSICGRLVASLLDFWSFWNGLRSVLGGLLGALGALGPLLGDLGSVLAGQGRSWAALGRFWAALGRSWVALGSSWAALGSSWAALGAVLGRSWGGLGCSWGALRCSWRDLGAPKSIFQRSWLQTSNFQKTLKKRKAKQRFWRSWPPRGRSWSPLTPPPASGQSTPGLASFPVFAFVSLSVCVRARPRCGASADHVSSKTTLGHISAR